MKLGTIRGPLTANEYQSVSRFANTLEAILRGYILGRQIEVEVEIRYADLPEYPRFLVKFIWAKGVRKVRFDSWKSLRELCTLNEESDLCYAGKVDMFVEKALSSLAKSRIT